VNDIGVALAQYAEFIAINKRWIASGRQPHVPRIERERYLGTDGGEEGCLVCGVTWARKTSSHPAETILKSD
jgi:hypothetical protein